MTTIQTHTFSNGFTVVLEPMPWLASASFTLLLPVGAVGDPKGQEGSATVLNDWLYRGAGPHDSKALSNELDGLGVRRGGGAGKEFSTFSGSLLAESLEPALTLYADIVRRPNLAEDEFAGARTLALQELESLKDSPTQQLFEALSAHYFASRHGNSSYGTRTGLVALSPDTVKSDFSRRYSPKGAILSVAGGVAWETVRTLAERLFADWSGAGVEAPNVQVREAHQDHVEQETSQVQIGVAYEAAAPGRRGWYENALAIGVLSGGMGARLHTEVREKRGLVYSVAAVSRALKGFGYTLAYAGTTTERADETLSVLLAELRQLSGGVAGPELERSRTGLLSRLVMQGESSGARASALARDAYLLGTPRTVDEVKTALEGVTLSDLNDYLADTYRPEFTILTLGSKALRDAVLA